ncbi:hypothetical protein JDV02_001035 [Purpureocillium takamizusanense]|uniref:DUF2428 domain-containing protein n=1 Tax=Purpureocillium takamizusanense TaxID=2060973 RepID=A0A9Q8V630_9HYPO|nr:uncharacterized protein JDV02_001035 [Purpureocillium takamizusanense]UNI14405.1 hypothetical protein JDV02_001035 [Purpureocillium takamizusanense]
MESEPLQQAAAGLLANPAQLIKWLETTKDPETQTRCAAALFDQLLGEAGQPKSVSGQACVRLCGLVEQSTKAESEDLRRWAFSHNVTLRLFNFFMDWNESDQHRSMKLVLDLVVQLIKKNPQQESALATRQSLLDDLISVVTGRSTKPVAKSAIKSLDHFLTRGVFTLGDIRSCYESHKPRPADRDDVEVWRLFMVDLFRWLRLHFVCPTAGKFIVSVYRYWHRGADSETSVPSMKTWYKWLLDFATEEPTLLESIKNYIFLPLLKADRSEALRFLGMMNEDKAVAGAASLDLDMPALLQLAALEAGKKVGLVEEPALGGDDSQDTESITVQEKTLDRVLAHPSHEVRALAMSLLITSPSTTRPYSFAALELLRKHLGAFFTDADAKFRMEIAGKIRDMFKRVRGAIHVLKRSIPRVRAKARKANLAAADADIASQPILYRSNLITLPEAQLVHCLGYHEKFLRWYIGFLCSELTPTASYQRHVASLKALMFITRLEGEAGKAWETADDQVLFFDLFDDRWARALFDLLMDPFDDVRDMSAMVLKRIYADDRYRHFVLSGHETSTSGRRVSETLVKVAQRAENLAQRTSRADHSDGASRAWQLVFRFLDTGEKQVAFLAKMIDELSRKTSMAETDLGRAVLEAPLHGDISSLNHIWQVVSELELADADLTAVQALQSRLVSCCSRVWDAVKDVLCDDSPEGHLPQELEDMEGLDTKGLLSFSFRAVHESSNLMRTMILSFRNGSREGFLIPDPETFESIGNLTFKELVNLRHRGAFTTVALTFATCCQNAKHVKQGAVLLDCWYQGTMNAIFTQASTTRRSAGIPSLMTGILSANASHPSFERVMEELMGIARREARVAETDGSNLPQVHAYNCLKDIFKNSMLTSMGNKSEGYLPQCLELAASGLRSEVWAIRNCGLIFLRSLIDCLFGSQESKSMIEAGWDGKANRIAYHRYPSLPAVLRNLLKSGHQTLAQAAATASSTAAESVFPALDIIRRAGPPELLRDEIQVHVAVYLSSPVWHVRELAARTLTSCLLHDKWLQTIRSIFRDAVSSRTGDRQNHIHGVLLALKFVIERLSEVALDQLRVDLEELVEFLTLASVDTKFPNCPEISAAYLAVVNLIWVVSRSSSQALLPITVTMPINSGSALLRHQQIIYAMHDAATGSHPVRRIRQLLLDQSPAADCSVTGLETLPGLWDVATSPRETLAELSALYIDVCLKTRLMEAQVVAIQNLADIVDELLRRNEAQALPTGRLIELWSTLSSQPLNPALANAVIRASGSIVAALRRSRDASKVSVHDWGLMMADAGLDDKVCTQPATEAPAWHGLTRRRRLTRALRLSSRFAHSTPPPPPPPLPPAMLTRPRNTSPRSSPYTTP